MNFNWSYSLETLNSGQNWWFWFLVTLKFDRWPWKTIGYLLSTASSFLRHFKAMGEFKLELQSINVQFGSKFVTFCPVWHWNLMDDLKNNRTPLLYYVKLCPLFQSHQWIKTWVTVAKPLIPVKISNCFLSHVTLKFDGWPWKTTGYLPLLYYFKLCASFQSHRWIQTWVTIDTHILIFWQNGCLHAVTAVLTYFVHQVIFSTAWRLVF